MSFDVKDINKLQALKEKLNSEMTQSNEVKHIDGRVEHTKREFDNKINNMICKRGEIFYSDLNGNMGSEQGGIRPVLIIQNDTGNRYSPTVIVAVLTSQINKAKIPTHIELSAKEFGLSKDSVILFEQIRTLDKRRLKEKICTLDEFTMKRVDNAIMVSLYNQKPKTTFERLTKENQDYIVNKLNIIKECDTVLRFLTRVNGHKKDIDIAEDEKFEAENALMSFCYKHGLNCDEFYTQENGVNEEIAL